MGTAWPGTWPGQGMARARQGRHLPAGSEVAGGEERAGVRGADGGIVVLLRGDDARDGGDLRAVEGTAVRAGRDEEGP